MQGQHATLESAVLTDDARLEARRVGKLLAERFPNADGRVRIVSSTLQRAKETAELVRAGWSTVSFS